MRFGEIILAYFVIGALMWGGGLIAWGDIGVANELVENPEDGSVETKEVIEEDLEGIGGAIASLVNTVAGGALLAVWGILNGFVTLVFWPIQVLQVVNAPARITVLVGGALSLIFVVGVIRVVRGTA